MKRSLIIVLLLVATCSIQAQTEQGTVAFGLHNFSPILSSANILAPTNAFGIGFGTSKSRYDSQIEHETKYTSVGFNGSAHYFILDNLSGGLNLNIFYQKEKEKSGTRDEYTTRILMAGPELRYYAGIGAKSKVFVKGNVAFGNFKSKLNGMDHDEPNKLRQFGGGLGLALFLSPHVSLDLGLGYSTFKSTIGADSSTSGGVLLDVGFTAFL